MTGQKQMEKQSAYLGLEAEKTFGYAQAVRIGDTIHVSGQVGLDEEGRLASPAPRDANGRPTDFSGMEEQIRRAYACAQKVLSQLGSTLDDVVSETLFVLDVPTAFAVAGGVRKATYGTDQPQVTSNLIGVSGLALPGQLVEIAFVAVVKR